MQQPLRFATVGSVDDGKSTLIGRLLHDSKSIFEDQLEHVAGVSKRRGDDYVDLSLLTDGLRAEREQGITIDVAYRYFATPKRSFIVADCPGHIQYTKNMVTGASNVDLAIILIDARTGVIEQTRRHALLASLLGVPHLVIAVNKMDLVDYAEERFEAVRAEFEAFAEKIRFREVTFIPISALAGDNVVDRSAAMPWYQGYTLLGHLETVYTASDANLIDLRLPVQCVIRPQRSDVTDYRGYAGRIAAGTLRRGDKVVVLPSGLETTVTHIETAEGEVEAAKQGRAVTVRLADDISVTRGDMLCRPKNRPKAVQHVDAMVAWLSRDVQLVPGRVYGIKHTTRTARAKVTGLQYRLDVSTLHRENAEHLGVNDIGRVQLQVTTPLLCDDYERNRSTGSFILIDETSGDTVGAGMILDDRQ
jgi:bifunctional enzyme CysN/CysC